MQLAVVFRLLLNTSAMKVIAYSVDLSIPFKIPFVPEALPTLSSWWFVETPQESLISVHVPVWSHRLLNRLSNFWFQPLVHPLKMSPRAVGYGSCFFGIWESETSLQLLGSEGVGSPSVFVIFLSDCFSLPRGSIISLHRSLLHTSSR